MESKTKRVQKQRSHCIYERALVGKIILQTGISEGK